jgi:hypothetical protein
VTNITINCDLRHKLFSWPVFFQEGEKSGLRSFNHADFAVYSNRGALDSQEVIHLDVPKRSYYDLFIYRSWRGLFARHSGLCPENPENPRQ